MRKENSIQANLSGPFQDFICSKASRGQAVPAFAGEAFVCESDIPDRWANQDPFFFPYLLYRGSRHSSTSGTVRLPVGIRITL